MVFRGHIERGSVVFDDPSSLADGTPVEIHVVAQHDQGEIAAERPWFKFSGAIKDLPPDASLKVDEVLYGRPTE